MTVIVTRASKGATLTHAEMDANFDNLKATADSAASVSSAHVADTLNPHAVTAAQAGAVAKTGDTMTGPLVLPVAQFSGGVGTQGTVSWNTDEETLDLIQNGETAQLGQEMQFHCRNASGSTITKGTPVMATGALGASGRITIAPMDGTDPANVIQLMGVLTHDILNGADGKVSAFGKIRGVDTSAYADGTVLYISTTTIGALQSTAPTTGMRMPVAIVVNSHAINGTLMVRVTPIDVNGFVSQTSATGSAQLPLGTTAQRAGGAGSIRANSDYGKPEFTIDGVTWTGLGGAEGAGGDAVFYYNDTTVAHSVTIPDNTNAHHVGPLTPAAGVVITLGAGSRLVIS